VFDLTARQKLNRGYSDGLSRALEIVVTPLLLGFLGHLIDGGLGTSPGFTLGLGIFGVCGIVAKMWLGYDREMRKHEAQLPGTRPNPGTGLNAGTRPNAGTGLNAGTRPSAGTGLNAGTGPDAGGES
jgi:hypothetical protein